MKRSLLTLLLVIVLIPWNTVNAAENDTQSDEAVLFLEKIGIVEPAVNSGSEMTRGEAAASVVKCMGIDAASYEDKTFTDITGGKYAGYITVANKLNLISGFDDGTFKPEEKVTFNQLVKMLVHATGYSVYAENMGGYPAGYLAIAERNGMLKGIANAGEAPITMETAARLIKNALDINIMEGVKYSAGHMNYAELENETLLTKYHSIYKYEGIVTGTYETALVSDRSIKKGEVAVEGEVFSSGDTNAEDYFCQYVTAYVKKDDIDSTIIYISPDKNNKKVSVLSDNILTKTTEKTLWHKDGNRDVSISISDDAVLIYNCKMKLSWTKEDLMPQQGEVVLISPKGGGFKYIIVNSYETKIVDSVNVLEKTVYFKGGGQMKIDREDKSVKTVFKEKNGKDVDLNYCFEWDIFSIIKSADNKLIKIIRSEDFVSGTIMELGENEIIIDGKAYPTVDSLMENPEFGTPKVMMEGDFYFDYAGRIAAIEEGAVKVKNYGYLVSGSYKEGLSSSLMFKIFTSAGEMKTFAVGEYLTVNDVRIKRDDITKNASAIYVNGEAVRQLISYEVDGGGLLTEVKTANDYTNDSDNPDRLSSFSRDFYINNEEYGSGTGGKIKFVTGNIRMFATRFMVKDTTVIFMIPGKDADDAEYAIKPVSELYYASINTTVYKNINLFDIDKDYVITTMVWDNEQGYESMPVHSDTVLYVSEVVKGLNDKEEDVVFIKGINESGSEIKAYAANDFDVFFGKALTDMDKETNASGGVLKDKIKITDIKAGDIIQYKAKSTGELTLLNVLFRGETPAEYEKLYDSYTGNLANPGSNGVYVCMHVGYGEVTEVLKYGVLVKIKDRLEPEKEYIRLYPFTAKIILKERDKSQLVTSDALVKGDKVAGVINTANMDMIVIYR